MYFLPCFCSLLQALSASNIIPDTQQTLGNCLLMHTCISTDPHSQVWLWLNRKRKRTVAVWDNGRAVVLISRSALRPSRWVTAPSHWQIVTGSIHNTNNDMRSFPRQSNKPQIKAPNLNTEKVCLSLSPSTPVSTSGMWTILLSRPGLGILHTLCSLFLVTRLCKVLSIVYRWRKWNSQRWSNLPKVKYQPGFKIIDRRTYISKVFTHRVHPCNQYQRKK